MFAGSVRAGSFNRKLAAAAAEIARERGAEVTLVDLKDFPLPIYDGDYEEREGVPANAKRLRDLMLAHPGWLLACPEYNASMTALLKNTIDWTSRPDGDVPGGANVRGRVIALVSASPGALGGMRGLVPVRAFLAETGAHVVPATASIGGARAAFGTDGKLSDEQNEKRLRGVVDQLVAMVDKLG